MQKTLKNSVYTSGIGLHSGKPVNLAIHPALAGQGITFIRMDIKNKNNVIPALWNYVVDTKLCTVIGNKDGITVATIEHLMSALSGCGVDNAVIELDGPEVPAMDGSALPFITLIEQAGLILQMAPRRAVRVLKEISVEQDGKKVTLSPADESVFSGTISFDHANIGTQNYTLVLSGNNFRDEVSNARTFGFLHEVEWMRRNGLGLGGSLDNAIVLNDDGVMNSGGLRHSDEFIRHKILDAVGDIYLAGSPVLGAYHGTKGGHALNNAILRKLFANPDAWDMVDIYDDAKDVAAPPESLVKA